MKEEKIAEQSSERDSQYFEIHGLEKKNHIEKGNQRLNSDPGSTQEIAVYDSEEYFVGPLKPKGTLVHNFRHFVRMEGTTNDYTKVAYIYVKREY